MRYARKTIYFSVWLTLLLLISCASTQDGTSTSKILSLSELTTPDNAQKALIILQDLRLTTISVFTKSYNAGKKTEEDYHKLKSIDDYFRIIWAQMDELVTTWKLTGKRPQFEELYNQLIKYILEAQRISGGAL